MLTKTPTGIRGFDEITNGGIPQARTTLIAGNAGCGKTTFAMHFLVNGAYRYDEPGVYVTFEESESDLIDNFSGFDIDLDPLLENESRLEREIGISSLVDSWIELRSEEYEDESYSDVHIVKARGMNHSRRHQRLIISDKGLSTGDLQERTGDCECREHSHE